jgi:predicted O-methyltransferase YrrM
LKPALETLDELLVRGEAGRFDFAFIDADKPNYVAYYERLMQLVRGGGLIAVDNTLALSGTPIISQDSENAKAMRVFNDLVHHDERVDVAMLTVGEGLTLLRVR